MSIKDLKKSSKPPIEQEKEIVARKKEADKLKHQSVIRFTDSELEQLNNLGLVYNGKIDNKRLREFIISKI